MSRSIAFLPRAAGQRAFSRRRIVAGLIAVAAVSVAAPPAAAQFDFSDALSAKIRTYPVKRDKSRPVPGKDGMPQPEALRGGRPVGVTEFPALPLDQNFPGGSMLDALQHYQKQDALEGLTGMLALLKNGFLELEIEKFCHVDVIKLQYEHRPTKGVPSFEEAGLGLLMGIVADGAKAAELQRIHERLLEQYNSGLSTNRERDQETMAAVTKLRLVIAARYNPRVSAPFAAKLPPREAKERFKAEVAKGKPVAGELTMGALNLAVRAKLDHRAQSPLPAACKARGK